jgi:Prealbumin-like fold domain
MRSTNISFSLVKQPERSSVEVSMPLRGLTLIGFVIFAAFCYAQTAPTPMPQVETGIEGVIMISPAHPGPVRPGVAGSRPLANTTFVVSNATNAVAEFTTDDQGRFKIALAPGRYSVARKGEQHKIGRYGPFDVDVAASQVTKVEWRCDTGMR